MTKTQTKPALKLNLNKVKEPDVQLVWNTPDPRKVIAIAARMTYSAKPVNELMDKLKEEEIAKSVKAILERRHYSVLRHVSFMFTVSNVSRAFSHQLVRHTAGHAYEQRSQHYRTEKNPNVVVPKSLKSKGVEESYVASAVVAFNEYEHMMDEGVPKDDARFILPNGIETQLVWTANLEALLNFIKARACRVNTPEIMSVAIKVRKIILEIIPEASEYMGPTCLTQGVCFEGDKFYKECNMPWKSPAVLWRPDFPKRIELISVSRTNGLVIETDLFGELFKEKGTDNE